MFRKQKEDEIINVIRNKIIDLIIAQDIDVQVKHEDFNEYVDFELGQASGFRRALEIINNVMDEYDVEKTY